MRTDLKYVQAVKFGAKVYYYFRFKGLSIRLPDVKSPDFLTRYNELTRQCAYGSPRAISGTIAALIAEYRGSKDFERRAKNTRKVYNIYLDRIGDAWGAARVADIKVENIYRLRDKAAVKTVAGKQVPAHGRANLLIGTLGALMAFAVKRGYRTDNPCRTVDRLEMGEHLPWPLDVIDAAMTTAEPMHRLALCLLLYTGQRIGDVCAMTHAAVRGGYIEVKQQKRGKRLSIPIHEALQAAMEAVPRVGLNLIYRDDGKPFSTEALRERLAKLAPGHTPHGLRKNAVMGLLEAGASMAEVQSITGQSPQMVEYYARRIDQKSLASSAILKWEQTKKV